MNIDYYSAVSQGNKYLLPNEIICLLSAGVKITSSFLYYLKKKNQTNSYPSLDAKV